MENGKFSLKDEINKNKKEQEKKISVTPGVLGLDKHKPNEEIKLKGYPLERQARD